MLGYFETGGLGDKALIVTKDKTIYAMGDNTDDCLGIDSLSNVLQPKKLEFLGKMDIKTFAYGRGPHVLVLTEDGKVYSWSYNRNGELGLGNYGDPSLPKMIYDLDNKIVDIGCGSFHSLALTKDGEVYAWGSNINGQIGSTLANKVIALRVVRTFNNDSNTRIGRYTSWGSNNVGQLGIGNYTTQDSPHLISSLIGVVIVKVVCGSHHTLVLTDEGTLYVWGSNSYRQLGIISGPGKTNVCSPATMDPATGKEMGKISDIAAVHTSNISVALCTSGCVYVWGHCNGKKCYPTATLFSNIHEVFACYTSVMHKPLILCVNKQPSILECLSSAFNDPVLTLTIEVEGQVIHVHKVILKIRSSYFRIMFKENWAENNQSIIQHNQFSYVVHLCRCLYKAFLKYLYTGILDLPIENVFELLDLTNAYCETDLKRHCINIVKQEVTVKNVIPLYNSAIKKNMQELEKFCFEFALEHTTAVSMSETFAELDDVSTLRTFIIKAASANAFRT
ncbi:RCC1 and BTB domain-containing protein [Ooceraea biroi]|uniref:RCC1 and BTB domain-containing protein n=1 Tax=Ooceraea biroi TaxID=2015173 RepID=A0A026WQC1_OOCBI|nr:RCC1 and BTB domain-containing protein [Ooceraea biroi]